MVKKETSKIGPTDQEKHGWLQEAFEDIELACLMLKEDKLAEQIKLSFNLRFTRRAGDANYKKMEIRLSLLLWPRMTEEERTVVVFHEACHIVDVHQNGRVKPHGKSWKELTVKCGLPPERNLRLERSDLYRPVRTFDAYCSCGTHTITTHKRTKILNGRIYCCTGCNGDLKLLE